MGAIILKIKEFLIVSLAMLACACYFVTNTQVGAPRPRVVPPQEVPKVIRAIPSYTMFSYSGLCFFNKKLYAASNIGLLEFDGGTLSNLYKWHDRDDVVSGPWPDIAGKSLWAKHEGIGKLIRYDGNAWELTEFPRPKEGYSRGDMLEGFRGTGTPEGFWLEGGGHAWRWDGQKTAWEPVPMPQDYRLVRIIPLTGKMLTVIRHTPMPFLVKKEEDFQSDVVQYFDGQWRDVPNKTGKSFFADEIIVIKDMAYLLTLNGLILRVTPSEITKLESPEACEAIAATTSGSLLASFRASGIYEYTNGWQKRFPSPYPNDEAEHWAYLTESNGQVAFAISSKPQGYGDGTKFPGQTALWVSRGSELKAVTIGEQ